MRRPSPLPRGPQPARSTQRPAETIPGPACSTRTTHRQPDGLFSRVLFEGFNVIKKNGNGAHALAGIVLSAFLCAPSAVAAGKPLPIKSVTQGNINAMAGARLVVRYRDDAAPSATKLGTVNNAAARAKLVQSAATRSAAAQPLVASYVRKLGVKADLVRLSRTLTPAEMSKLVAEVAADKSVLYVTVDRKMYPIGGPALPLAAVKPKAKTFSVPSDPYYAEYQWHLFNEVGGINAPAAWDIATGAGVVVAVLDTGVLTNHPDLSDNLLPGYDFITDSFVSRRPTNDRVPGALDQGDWTVEANECYEGSTVHDSSWHGSHVAGTVAEMTNNSVGMAGVAFNAKVLPVRVLGRCGGYTSDIADAITWASGGTVAGVPANATPAKVINMSLGGGGACDTLTQDAINGAVSRGVTVVVAAGNSAANSANFSPASCANVITVGANGIKGGRAVYSNYGAVVDISAPGGGVIDSTVPAEQYVWQAGYDGLTTPTSGSYTYAGMAGTSMASPHVAGVVALVQSAAPTALSPAQVETLLKRTARAFPVAIPSSTPIGVGIVNAKKALDKALEPPGSGPVATPLINKIDVTGLTGAGSSEELYSFEAATGSVLSFMTLGGNGDVSIYVSFESEPTTTAYDFKSTRPGNSETVRITAPKAGNYYVKLVGVSSYSGVTLVARQ